jgi:hypothetical protein
MTWLLGQARKRDAAPREVSAPSQDPCLVRVSEIRQGDRFLEVFAGNTDTFVALEDAHPCRFAPDTTGYRFTAFGAQGPQEFYCATGFENYGPQLYRLPASPTPQPQPQNGSHPCPNGRRGGTGLGRSPGGSQSGSRASLL